MKLNEFLKSISEELDIESSAPKELNVERYGDDDGGGKGPQMGTRDPWEEFKEAAKLKAGYAVAEGDSVFGFYIVSKDKALKFENWMKSKNLEWENIEDYDPSEYEDDDEEDDED